MDSKKLNSRQPCFPRKTPPYRVFFTWEITYNCNYRCTYCHAPKPGNPDTRKTTSLDAEKWIRIWGDVYKNYGTCFILISGGEPFAYPSFKDLVAQLHKKHIIELCTNLEWDVEAFVKNMDPKRIKVGTSLHPEFTDLDRFLHRLKLLKDNGFRTHVNFVPWPPLLSKMAEYKERVEGLGVQFILQPFIGEYEKRKYPQGYTEGEREYFKIFKDSCNISTLDFKTTNESDKKGKLCRMGQNYAFIHPDGEADRCCKDHSVTLGNVIDGTFRLLEEPAPCTIKECNCWRCMLVETEPGWVQHWGWAEMEEIAPVASKLKKEDDQGLNVALIQTPPWGIFDPPNALAQISSFIKRDGHRVSVFDVNIGLYNKRREQYDTIWAIEQSGFWHNQENVLKFFNDNSETINDFIQRIIAVEPEVIGLSVSSASLYFVMEFVKKIKEKRPQVKIIFGGSMFFVPADIENILNNDCVDIVILGEGEETFSELLQTLRDGRDIDLCKGICFKKGSKTVRTEPRPYIKNLDELPFLDFTDLSLDRYDPPGHLGRHISLMTSRGCIQNCAFCGPKVYWKGFRMMSGRRIYDEIRHHISCNPDIEHIEFLDLLFNGNMKALNEFCDLMISGPLKEGLRWHVNAVIRPEMTSEVLQKMRRAGCHHVTYGIESGSQKVLDLMRKRYRIKDADEVLRNTRDADIEVTCNFMFGFPGETEEDFQETLGFLKRNARHITTAYPSRTYCTVEPFSYMKEHMEEFDMIPNERYPIYWESHDGRNNYPERLRRCEVFSDLALSLGVAVGSGLQTSVELDKWFNLGFYYLAKKDNESAKRSFHDYLKLDPKNEVINNKIHELNNMLNADKPCLNGGISFNWDIHYRCNYRCPYCWFYGKWAEINRENSYPSLKKVIDSWKNIRSNYGSVKIAITGGEPFLYPDFLQLIKELSQMHKIEIISNLSVDIGEFVKSVNQANVRINPSFHPLFADIDKFIDRVLVLKDAQMTESISYLSWPPQIQRLSYYQDRFGKVGINLSLQSFFGEHKGLRYPDGYTGEEKGIIMPNIGNRGGKPFQTEPIVTRGRSCAAGRRYGVIHPDGKVLRCGGINSEDSIVGNLFNENFKLLDKSLPCASEICPCNEWAFLLEGTEQELPC